MNSPIIAGKLRVTSGKRLPCTAALAGLEGLSAVASSVPHTRQRVASSLKRVPQVGHSFVVFEVISGLISLSARARMVFRLKPWRLYQIRKVPSTTCGVRCREYPETHELRSPHVIYSRRWRLTAFICISPSADTAAPIATSTRTRDWTG